MGSGPKMESGGRLFQCEVDGGIVRPDPRIAATRLRAPGVGLLSPVAPNDTDAGRAKNRRVELVKQ
jgi:hypothetical protein